MNETQDEKLRELLSAGELFVVAFFCDWKPRLFTQQPRFYLRPNLPFPFLRHVSLLAIGSILALWLGLRKDVRILVAQSPYEGLAAALAKTVLGVLGKDTILVIESHGDLEEALFLQRRVLLSRLYRRMMRWVVVNVS